MNKRRMLALALSLLMLVSLIPVSASAAGCTEVASAEEMMQALAETPAHPASKRTADIKPTYVLVLGEPLPDRCGSQRVLHYAAYDEYVLEFATRAAAEAGYRTLTETYGLERCWLDTPEQGARVTDDGAAPMAASSVGANYMNLTSYRGDRHTQAHFDAGQACVAIIDSGVDPAIDALRARSFNSYDFVNNTTELSDVTSTGNARGHGTRVASILDALLPAGVRFMYLRVFDNTQSAARINVITAIQYAAERGANVINMSLGWEDDVKKDYTFLNEVLRTAYNKGITMVCAAGNGQQDVAYSYPASSPYTIAVSAVDAMRRFESRYSNWGEKIDFCGPGSGIVATTYGGSLVTCTGTSFAAPHITAAVAELQIMEPAAPPVRIYSLLKQYAQDLGDAGKDGYYGWGLPVLPESYPQYNGHIWDSGRITKPATVTEDGQRVITCTVCGTTMTMIVPATGQKDESVFVDVPKDQYYAIPVVWATANGITTGVNPTHFNPNGLCTRAQVVTFLWREAGSPKPETDQCPFSDVLPGSYYYDAVLWAVENGVTNGTSSLAFSPDETCTRAQVVTLLWRFDQAGLKLREGAEMVLVLDADKTYHTPGCPHLTEDAQEMALPDAIALGYAPCTDCRGGAAASDAPVVSFADVPDTAYYAEAVRWAVATGITNGMTPTTFGPSVGCTRAHVVTFLYRYINGAE